MLVTDDHVQLQSATTVRSKGILDVIDPAEALLALAPSDRSRAHSYETLSLIYAIRH
jgi:hypothetical protein